MSELQSQEVQGTKEIWTSQSASFMLTRSKCTHVVTSSPDPPSPLTPDSEAFEPVTPESAYMPDPMGFSQDALVEEFGDFLNYDQL